MVKEEVVMKNIRRPAVLGIIIIVCFLLETTVFQNLALGAITPNLLIAVTSSFGSFISFSSK